MGFIKQWSLFLRWEVCLCICPVSRSLSLALSCYSVRGTGVTLIQTPRILTTFISVLLRLRSSPHALE